MIESNFKTHEFTKLALHAQHRLPLGIASTLKANRHIDYASEHLILTLKAYVASDGPRLKVISYPATWQDAVLARFIPLKWQGRFSWLRPRINKRLYMNGKCLNENGPEWGLYGIPMLPGPTVSDGISRPILVPDDGLKLTEA